MQAKSSNTFFVVVVFEFEKLKNEKGEVIEFHNQRLEPPQLCSTQVHSYLCLRLYLLNPVMFLMGLSTENFWNCRKWNV